jgi:P4 family phage/plasmid primase-like protien
MQSIFGSVFTNSYEDIYDEAVIQRNNWFLYGSKKPDEDFPWVVSKVYDYNINEIDNEKTDAELVELLSIRNKYDACKVCNHKAQEVKQWQEKHNKPTATEETKKPKAQLPSDLETIAKLVMMLKPDRADAYADWLKLAMILKKISEGLFDVWIEFSQQSHKFDYRACEQKWQSLSPQMGDGGVTEGTLRHWAEMDNPKAYKELRDTEVNHLIYTSRLETHYDIAKVIHALYRDRFVCCYNGNYPVWYEFKNHRWFEEEDGASLKLKISTEVFKRYCVLASHYNAKATTTESDTEQAVFAEVGKQLSVIALKLKNAGFKKNLMIECNALFKVSSESFVDKFDSLHHIIGFENGVYDLKEKRFRVGKPDDFVKSSVGYDYACTDDDIRNVILQFIRNILPSVTVMKYLLFVLAYNLSGNKFMEQAWFLTGHGRNGKGTLMTLYEQTLRKGQYYHEGDVAVLTNIKKDANSASSAIMALKNKRVAVFSESEDKDETIKVKILKQIVGRDLIQGREMYAKKTVEFRPTFSLMFLMNDMPKLSKLEGNLLEKLNVIRFPYRFCDNPQADNEKPIDRTIKNKFEDDIRYRQQFMNILIECYHEFEIGECKIMQTPDEVKAETNAYFEENNEVGMWLDAKCIVTNDNKDRITPTDLFQLFNNDNKCSSIRLPEFGKMMAFNGYRVSKHGGTNYYKGIKYNNYLIDDEEDY